MPVPFEGWNELGQEGYQPLGAQTVRRRPLELQVKLLGELDERPIVNVLVSQEWVQVRLALLGALQPYPDARAAVTGRLAELEAG